MKNPPLTSYAISRIEVDADLDNASARRDLGLRPLDLRTGLDMCFGSSAPPKAPQETDGPMNQV